MQDLGTLGGAQSSAFAINNSGEITGWADTPTSPGHAFVYIDGSMYDLNSLVVNLGGITLEDGRGINDAGQITGVTRQGEAFLLTPVQTAVPEPASLLLTGTAFLAGIGILRRRVSL